MEIILYGAPQHMLQAEMYAFLLICVSIVLSNINGAHQTLQPQESLLSLITRSKCK